MQPPRRLSRIGQAALAAQAVIKGALGGQLVATPDLADQRLQVCGRCPQFNGDTCAVCRCHMRLKVKLQAMVCPIGNW